MRPSSAKISKASIIGIMSSIKKINSCNKSQLREPLHEIFSSLVKEQSVAPKGYGLRRTRQQTLLEPHPAERDKARGKLWWEGAIPLSGITRVATHLCFKVNLSKLERLAPKYKLSLDRGRLELPTSSLQMKCSAS